METLEELLIHLGIDYRTVGQHHHARRGWIQIDCPECTPDAKSFRCGINQTYLYANCYQCGRINLFKYLTSFQSNIWKEVKKLRTDLFIPYTEKIHRKNVIIPFKLKRMGLTHKDYLRGRNYSLKELNRLWDINKGTFLTANNHYSWRVWIPIYRYGKIVSWTTRSVVDNVSKRYYSADSNQEVIHHKDLLYGEDYCTNTILVMEGPADVWRFGPGGVCTFGTNFTQKQVNLIRRYPTRIICFDDSAQKEAKRLCDTLSIYPGKTVNIELDYKDMGETPEKEVNKIRRMFFKE